MMQAAKEMVQVQNLHKSYGSLEVLRGIGVVAREGEVVTMIGASGSGKSTLLRCINLMEIPNQGTLTIEGQAIEFHTDRKGRYLPKHQKQVDMLRQRVGMVFQSFNLWAHRTVLENVIEAPIYVKHEKRAEAIEHAHELLQRVGLYEKRDVYPAYLSGGQQQRVAIARALAMRPQVLLFDEPTSALDPEMVGDVLKVIRNLASEGRTMLLVTHEMAFARDVSNQVIFLHKGLVEEQGSPEQVFTQPKSERCAQFVSTVRHVHA